MNLFNVDLSYPQPLKLSLSKAILGYLCMSLFFLGLHTFRHGIKGALKLLDEQWSLPFVEAGSIYAVTLGLVCILGSLSGMLSRNTFSDSIKWFAQKTNHIALISFAIVMGLIIQTSNGQT